MQHIVIASKKYMYRDHDRCQLLKKTKSLGKKIVQFYLRQFTKEIVQKAMQLKVSRKLVSSVRTLSMNKKSFAIQERGKQCGKRWCDHSINLRLLKGHRRTGTGRAHQNGSYMFEMGNLVI